MQLILLRHGQAQPKHKDVGNENRSLTEHGMRDAGRTATMLRDREVVPSVIWTSPYLRAMQTAGVLARMTAPAPRWRSLVAPPMPTPPAVPQAMTPPTRAQAQTATQAIASAANGGPSSPAEVVPVAVEELTHEREHWRGKRGRQNLDAIIARLVALPADAVVAIVGHHHVLQALAYRLTGREVPRMPGAGALLFDDTAPANGGSGVMMYRAMIDPHRPDPRSTVI